MPSRKNKTRANAPADQPSLASTSDPETKFPKASLTNTTSPSFPFALYTSLSGVHLTLLGFTALYLPRTGAVLNVAAITQVPPTDRPQHPFLEPLTASPLLTLGWLCLGTAVLQSWWSGWIRQWWFELLTEEKAKKDGQPEVTASVSRMKLSALRNAALATLATSLIFHGIFILFGAPLATHHAHTYLLSLLLSLLVVHTPAYTLGPPSFASDTRSLVNRLTWVRLFAEISPKSLIEKSMVYPVIGAAFGCWSGALPIPLDWDRPWQAWPLTPAYGAVFGYMLGSLWAFSSIAISLLAETH